MATLNKHLVRAQAAIGALAFCAAAADAGETTTMPSLVEFANASGYAATYSTAGPIDLTGPFFQSLGTNGRSCVSCHQPSEGWAVTPAGVQARFDATGGTDPIFRTNDGSNAPELDVSTVDARRAAYSMLLSRGVIRVGMPIPANAEFDLVAVDDPYGHANAADLSLFRRPLPATNLKFLSTVMWDGRETFLDPKSPRCVIGTSNCFATLHADLADQANSATTGHAQAAQALTDDQRNAIVAFEMSLYTAQVQDDAAGNLTAWRASGGALELSDMPFYFGINDVVAGDYETGTPFSSTVFDLYDTWDIGVKIGLGDSTAQRQAAARSAVVRGQELFNNHAITITGVKGLNDDLGIPSMQGTCTTCHDAPNAGNHSIPAPLDIGIADASRRTPDMPLYTLRNRTTGETIQTTDPGRALVTGRWKDIARFKGPVLRALATRAPYFHNGMAQDLDAVVDFYDTRFNIGFTADEKQALVAFLRTL
jgi:cytochrome c peroxidase